MIRYLLKRSQIALKEKWKWTGFAVIGIALSIVYLLLAPSEYIITSSIEFKLNDTASAVDIPENKVWRQIISAVGPENAFLTRYSTNLPRKLQTKIIETFSNENNTVPGNPNIRNFGYHQKPQTMIAKLLSLKADNVKKSYLLRFEGSSQSLGIELINFYTSKLLEHVKERIQDRINYGNTANRNVPGLKKRKKASKLIMKVDIEKGPRDKRLSGLDPDISKLILGSIDFAEKSGPEVISDSDLSPGTLIKYIIFSGIISILIILVFIIVYEFSSKHLSSEMQVARYLNSHIIGSIGRLESVENSGNHKE